jgi:integrase
MTVLLDLAVSVFWAGSPVFAGYFSRSTGWRLRHWTPALRAAGIEHRSVYTTRHTFASWSIRAGVQMFHLSRIMGTSVEMISQTYGHLVPDSEEYLRGLLDEYDLPTKASSIQTSR